MTQEKKIYGLISAGGFAREVMPIYKQTIDALHSDPHEYVMYFVEQNPSSKMINNIPCISDEEFISQEGDKYFNISISDGQLREKMVQKFEPYATPIAITANSAEFLGHNEIHPSSIFCSKSMVTSNAVIGKYFHCNIYSYIAHDCTIGDFVTFAPKVCCNGNIVIKDYAYIGTGAVIKQGSPDKPLIIGENAIVGMGAVVTKDVPANTVVVGNPARPIT